MNTKRSILLSLVSLLLVISTKGQTKEEENIAFIRKVFQQTNAEKNLTQVKLENEELTDELPDGGISLTGYFKEQALLKIELWTGLSYGILQIEYYFSNDSLLFAYVTEKHFRQSADSVDYSKPELVFEGRYYYKKEKPINKSPKGKGFWNNSSDGEKSLLPDSRNYLKLLYAKKKNGR
jgi:hypothetical protein